MWAAPERAASVPSVAQDTIRRGSLGHYAGFISRLLALIVDAAVFGVVWIVVLAAVSYFSVLVQLTTGVDMGRILGPLIPDVNIPDWLANATGFVFSSFFLFAVYEVFFLSTAGRTVGKTFMGLRVVNATGQHPTLLQAIIRQAVKYPAAAALFAGYLVVLLDDQRQGWHDKIARTYVVYTWDARPDETFLANQIEWLHQAQRNTQASRIEQPGQAERQQQ